MVGLQVFFPLQVHENVTGIQQGIRRTRAERAREFHVLAGVFDYLNGVCKIPVARDENSDVIAVAEPHCDHVRRQTNVHALLDYATFPPNESP